MLLWLTETKRLQEEVVLDGSLHRQTMQALWDWQCVHFRSCVWLQFEVFWINMVYHFSATSSPAATLQPEYFCFCKQLCAVLSRPLCDLLPALLIPFPGTNLPSIKSELWGCREIKSGQIFWSTLFFLLLIDCYVLISGIFIPPYT